jgi:drug/metabolite transporter (DMT)-like permease
MLGKIKKYWQMNALTKKIPYRFSVLCFAVTCCAILLSFGSSHWEESLVLGCFFICVGLWTILLGWSIWSIRRHRARAIAGALICAFCLWQVLQTVSRW